jgi:hypothetical protein
MRRPLGIGYGILWKPALTPPGPQADLEWFADVSGSFTLGSTLTDGQLITAWGPSTSVVGAPRLVTDSVSGGKAVRTRTGDRLRTAAGAAAFTASGEYTIQFAWRHRANGTNTRPVLFDGTQDGTKLGMQVLAGDFVDSIFYGRSMAVRQWDGAAWYDSDSLNTSIGAFFPQRWNIVTIAVTSTHIDIRVNGSRIWAGGKVITKPYVTDLTAAFDIGGAASDYKAVRIFSRALTEDEKDTTEQIMSARCGIPLTITFAGDPTLLLGASGSATFPYISKLPNGKLYATAYMGVDGPTATDTNISRTSTDGYTWSAPVVETQNTNNLRYSDLKTSEPYTDGSIIQTTFTYDASNKTQHHPIWRRSTDSGVTWSAWADANPGVTPDEAFVSQAPIEDPTQPGHLHMAVQTVETAGDTYYKLWDYQTNNAGATWTRVAAPDGIADSKKYAEPAMYTTAAGEFRMLIRDATVNGTSPMLQTRLTDHGVTWAAPAATNLPAWSSGQQARILASGREVWIARQLGSSNKAAIFWRAAGSAWNDPWNSSRIEIDPLWGGMYYAGIYEITPGKLVLIHSRSAAGDGHSNNIAVLVIDEWMLDFAMPGSATPATATGTAASTQQISVTGAGDFTFAITDNQTGGSVHATTGVYTYGATPGTDTVEIRDLLNKVVDTCAFTVAGGGGGGSVTITSIRPDSGYPAGGTSVTLTGSGFAGATGATVGGVALTSFVVVNDTTITGVTGAHAAGDTNVVVGTGTLTNGFTYLPAGPTLDLDADTLAFTNGADVTAWADRSGNGNDAAPATFNPTFATSGINGKRAVTFVAFTHMTFASFTTGLTAADIFVIAQNDDDGATASAPIAFSSESQNNFWPLTNRQIYDNSGSDTRYTTGFAPASGAWSSPWLANVIATGSEWTLRFNGVQAFTNASNTFDYGLRKIGAGTSTSTMTGKISRVLIYPSKLSDPNRAIVDAYLKRKFGIS